MHSGKVGLTQKPRHTFRDLHGVEAAVAALLTATLLAILLRDPLTSKTIIFNPAQPGQNSKPYAFSDVVNGGRSEAKLDQPLQLQCNLRRTFNYGFCGFGLLFAQSENSAGLDAGGLKSIELHLSYTGPGHSIRLSLKNRDSRYAAFGAKDLYKPLQATVPVRQGPQTVTVKASNLLVAQWWLESAKHPAGLSQTEFHNVMALEVLTGPDALEGEHHIEIDRIVLRRTIVSDEVWYGGILAVWFLVIGGLLLRSRVEISRWRRRFTETLSRLVDTIPHMVWSSSADGRIHYNKRWEEFTGAALGRGADVDQLIHPDDRQTVTKEWKQLVAAGEAFQLQYRLRHHSGTYRWVVNKAVPELDDKGAVIAWHGTCTDIHDRVKADQALQASLAELEWESEHDSLTSLANRGAFHARLEREARGLPKGKQIALLLIDVDHFKHINDSYGHAVGDELLRNIGKRLSNAIRQDDLAGRLGGDEFAIMLRNIGSPKEAAAAAAKLCSIITAPLEIGKRVLGAGASIGVALYPRDAVDMDELFKSADAALYELKRCGRGGVKMFRENMLDRISDAAHQLRVARTALNNDRIVPLYQPKVDLLSGSVVGFEALLRWNLGGKDLQLPSAFEEAFSDYELAAQIGEAMQRMVARDIHRWQRHGVEIGRVSINAAPAEFLRDDYAECLLRILSEENIAPSCIEIEITERALLERGTEFVRRALKLLRNAGIAISLDDFGTGYSSLSHLCDYSLDLVKIDRSFVQHIGERSEMTSTVSAIISLAQSFDIDVVAEGVETEDQARLLRTMGCRFAQGHLFGHAVSADSIAASNAHRSAA